MPRSSPTAKDLESAVEHLQQQRQAHLDALAEIDSIFDRYGINPEGQRMHGRRRGRPPGSGKKTGRRTTMTIQKRRGRRSSKGTGPDSVVGFVGKTGSKGVTSGAIVSHWKSEGRAGMPYRTIGMLVNAGRLKRHPLPGERGSRYTAP